MTETRMKNWDNVQPWPNPKPRLVVPVTVVEKDVSGGTHYSQGLVQIPVAGRLRKVRAVQMPTGMGA